MFTSWPISRIFTNTFTAIVEIIKAKQHTAAIQSPLTKQFQKSAGTPYTWNTSHTQAVQKPISIRAESSVGHLLVSSTNHKSSWAAHGSEEVNGLQEMRKCGREPLYDFPWKVQTFVLR